MDHQQDQGAEAPRDPREVWRLLRAQDLEAWRLQAPTRLYLQQLRLDRDEAQQFALAMLQQGNGSLATWYAGVQAGFDAAIGVAYPPAAEPDAPPELERPDPAARWSRRPR